MGSLVQLVITLVVVGLVVWLLIWLIDYIPLPAPFNKVAKVLIMIVSVLIVIYMLLGLTGSMPVLKTGALAPAVVASR